PEHQKFSGWISARLRSTSRSPSWDPLRDPSGTFVQVEGLHLPCEPPCRAASGDCLRCVRAGSELLGGQTSTRTPQDHESASLSGSCANGHAGELSYHDLRTAPSLSPASRLAR